MIEAARAHIIHECKLSALERWVHLLVASLISLASGGVQATTAHGSATTAADATSELAVYLAVTVNGRETHNVVRFVLEDGRLAARAADLQSIGIDVASRGVPLDSVLLLDALSGVNYVYDAAQQAVTITVPDALRVPFVYGRPDVGPMPEPTSGHGLLLNYDVYYQHHRGSNLSVWNDLRYFNQAGVLESTGATYSDRNGSRYIRFHTSWSQSDPDAMRTLRLGDTISSSLDWTRSVRMAGIQLSRNFDLRPDLVTFPMPQFAGTAAVPSTIDLYINNTRRLSTQVPDGPFIVQDTPGITGAGTATIVTRDALGRAVTTTLPMYVDRRMLAQGLSAYSIEAGFLRRNYGRDSFNYDRDPAAGATYRYGLTDYFTAEGHAEATRGMYNLGGGGLLRLGTAGVVSAAISVSSGSNTGTKAMLGYQLIQPRFTLDLQTTRTFGNYRDLGSTDGYSVPKAIDRATVAVPIGNKQSVALNFVNYESRDFAPSRVGSVAYSANMGRNVSMNLSAYKDFGPGNEKGVLLSVNIALDSNTHVNAYAGRQNGEASYNVGALRTPDYDGGWGWGVQAGRTAANDWAQAQTRYRGRYGEASLTAQHLGGQNSVALNVSGAAVLMDGNLALSRHIYDGFAMVSTEGVPGVPVLHENRRIGTTDRSGHYLVPDLNPYQRNRIAIDGSNLPANVKVANSKEVVVPQARSGVLVRFPLTEYRAASVVLHDERGEPLPVGTRILHEESGRSTVVGYDGIAFIEDLEAMNHLRIQYDSRSCDVNFAYPDSHPAELPTLGPLTCTTTRS